MIRPRALVTGGAKRVGAAICRELARAGCDVDLTYLSSENESKEVADEVRSLGVRCRTHQLDLHDLDAVERFGAEFASSVERLDVLVHNASIYEPTPLKELTASAALSNYRVNALAPALLTKAVADLMGRTRGRPGASPCVVAMCDMHVLGRPRKGFLAYAMSKAALVEMVRGLARELAPNVRVNGVAPGVVAFPESGYESDEEMQRRYLERVPLKTEGTPEDAASAVRWLALGAPYVTGEIIRVDGGRWLA